MKKINNLLNAGLLFCAALTIVGCAPFEEILHHGDTCSCNDCVAHFAEQKRTIDREKVLNEDLSLGRQRGYFIQNNSTDFIIVIADDADENIEYCASIIQSEFLLVSKANLPIKRNSQMQYSADDKVISLGDTIYKSHVDLSDIDYTTLTTGGYFIRNFNDIYILDSGCKDGRVYATHEFLNQFLHVTPLTPNYTYRPSLTNVESYDIDFITTPAFEIRDYYYYPVWYQGVQWGSKLRSNSSSYKNDIKVNGKDNYAYYAYYYTLNDQQYFSTREGHTIQNLLCIDAYKHGYVSDPSYKTSDGGASIWFPLGYWAEHPDWYAFDPTYDRINSRGYSQEEICYSNGLDDNGNYISQDHNIPEKNKSLVTKMSEIVVDMIKNEPSENAYYLMLGHADYYAKCKCAKCQAAYEKYGGFGGTTIVWGNAVIKEVKRMLAEQGIIRPVKFVMFAYSKSIDAPVKKDASGKLIPASPKVVCDDDLIIKMAYRNCVYHSLWDEHCEPNEVLRDRFKGWSILSKAFVIWDYSCVFTNYLFYLPNFGTIQDNYKYYQSIGVTHLLTQGSPSEYNYYESNLHAWVITKMMWDPNQNINTLIKRFNNLFFGDKYARYANEYRAFMDNYCAMRDVTLEGGYHASTDHDLDMENANSYDVNVLRKAADIIEEGLIELEKDPNLTKNEKETIESNLRSVKITPQYMMLTMNMLVDSAEIKAVAKDFFKSIDMLKLTYRCEGSTDANSFEQMKKGYDLN